MRILHLADLHLRESAYEAARASIEAIEGAAVQSGFDLIAISGDTWDGPIQNSERAGFGRLIELVRRLADIAPVAMIYGTPTHDIDGSLEFFERLTARHSITILRPGKAYFLAKHIGESFIFARGDLLPGGIVPETKLLLFGVPEPQKKWLLAGAGAIGKEESDQTIRSALQNLFLGLGGMRREIPNLPCILLYHGQLGGAKTPKNFTFEAGTGIAATRDDLAAVEADYYALGDIHLPQRIGDLPAYYPGPLYPTSWGETGFEFGANIVEIEARKVLVSRLPFPHPVQTKLETTAADPVPDTASGRVWVEVVPETQEQERLLDADELLARLIGHGSLPGSRVTIRHVQVETVRAGDIVEKKRHRDKVQVWAENSALPVSEGILAKADALELEAAAAGGAPSGSAFRITRLVLRGAKGIYKKSRKDEIDLDLEALGEGVIALVAPNGSGKTTILENLHPWPQLLTRKGTLQSHFRLRDSCRELYLTDEVSGTKYRVRILINAAVASGKTEYWMDRDTGAGFEPMPSITGRLDDYETVIADLFGSLPLFLKSAFLTQRPSSASPDLAEATKGERKALFAELLGAGYFDVYRASAKAKADALETDIRVLDATIAAADGLDETIISLAKDIEVQAQAEAEAQKILAQSAERVKVLAAEKDALEARVSEVNRKAEQHSKIEAEIAALMDAIEEDRKTEALFQEAAKGRGAAEKDLADLKELEAKAQKLRSEKAVIDQENLTAATAFRMAVADYEATRKARQGAVDLARDTKAKAERELSAAQERKRINAVEPGALETMVSGIAGMEEDEALLLSERERLTLNLENERKLFSEASAIHVLASGIAPGCDCPLCGSIDHPRPVKVDAPDRGALVGAEGAFEDNAKSLRNRGAALETARQAKNNIQSKLESLKIAEAEVKALEDRIEKLSQGVQAAEKVLAELQAPESAEPKPFPGAAELAEVEADIAMIDAAAAQEILRKAGEAEIRIEEAARRIKDKEIQIDKATWELKETTITIADAKVASLLDSKKQEYEAEREVYADARDAIARAQTAAEAAKKAKAAAEERKASLATTEQERAAKAADMADWRFLERADGPDGIPALELDALAPSIQDVANRILAEAYGSRYQIAIRTQRLAGKGSKTRAVEDFEIFIQDTEDGDEQEIATLSGGEAVWVKKALYDAFSVIRARNTGLRFQTVFLDEADGALDPDNRMTYLRMLEAAHREAGRYQTILVTHSLELQAMVAQTINVKDLGPRKTAQGVAA